MLLRIREDWTRRWRQTIVDHGVSSGAHGIKRKGIGAQLFGTSVSACGIVSSWAVWITEHNNYQIAAAFVVIVNVIKQSLQFQFQWSSQGMPLC
jgi:hypothetical protein